MNNFWPKSHDEESQASQLPIENVYNRRPIPKSLKLKWTSLRIKAVIQNHENIDHHPWKSCLFMPQLGNLRSLINAPFFAVFRVIYYLLNF